MHGMENLKLIFYLLVLTRYCEVITNSVLRTNSELALTIFYRIEATDKWWEVWRKIMRV